MRQVKRSFTSSSRRRLLVATAAFAVTLAAVVAMGQVAGTQLARRFGLGRMVMEDLPPAYEFPEPDDWYVAYDEFGLDHYILYYGLDESIERARRADVLVVGNSQVGYAFPKNMLSRSDLETGFTFYNLGFGYDERSAFILALIEKHDLRPKFVIANATLVDGDSFFQNDVRFLQQFRR